MGPERENSPALWSERCRVRAALALKKGYGHFCLESNYNQTRILWSTSNILLLAVVAISIYSTCIKRCTGEQC